MRILLTAHTFYPESSGGVERHVFDLANYLMKKGHDVGVFYRIYSPEHQEYALLESEWKSIRVFKVVHNFIAQMPNPYPFYDRQVEECFLEVLDKYPIDLMHIHHLGGLSTSLIDAAHHRGLPVLWTLHDFWPMCSLSQLLTPDGRLCTGPDDGMRCVECVWLQWQHRGKPNKMLARLQEIGWKNIPKRSLQFIGTFVAARMGWKDALWDNLLSLPARDNHMRRTLLKTDLLISPSRFLVDRFEDWGIPRSRFRYLQNGVPASLLRTHRETPPLGTRPFTFGFLGSLYPYKGIHILIDAFQRANLPDTMLRIWGGLADPQFRDYLASIEEKANSAANIRLEGQFPPEQLLDVLDQIDVLVMPSELYENNPLSILEALAAKVPIIAGNVGGMAELVQHDENGLLFQVGDPIDLASKMRMITDPKRLQRYRAAIHSPRSTEEVGAQLEQIYGEFVE
jgi:glycosyltransferase involved in cell wall biosynthesis